MKAIEPAHRRSRASGWARALPRRIPAWAIVVFSLGYFIALSPNLMHVYGIHNDYEMLIFKNHGLLFHEAEQLFSIARPIPALFSNLTLLPAETIADFRWTRLFSTVTVCFLGLQMMSICIHRLRVDTLPSVVIALVTFLVPAFIYSVLNAPAWATHLTPILIAFMAYEVLSRSNVQAIAFLGVAARWDYGGLWRQLWAYARLSSVWGASLVLQIAFYDFPPNALIIAVLPVVIVLFSRTPWPFRLLIAARDIGFLVANLVLYALSAKLIYIPFVRLLTFRNSDAWRASHLGKFDERVSTSYNYAFNTDPAAVLKRLHEVVKVSGDLWFLPQTRFHIVVGGVLVLALLVAFVRWRRSSSGDRPKPLHVALAVAVPVVCFLLATSAVLGASGGFVSYRTIPVSTMIAAILLVYAVGLLTRTVGSAIGRSAATGTALAAIAAAMTGAAAVVGNFEMNDLTMRLARNETAYFNGIVKQAIDSHSKAVIIVDPRPFSLPEDHPVMYDQHGHAVPPYELSCFSGVCLQNGAIVTILAEQQGIPRGQLPVYSIRGGDPVPGATCPLLTNSEVAIPTGLSASAVNAIKFLRGFQPVTCVTYSLDWHNLD